MENTNNQNFFDFVRLRQIEDWGKGLCGIFNIEDLNLLY